MNRTAVRRPGPSPFHPTHSRLVQRKCACGGTIGPTGECEQCRRKRSEAVVGGARHELADTTPAPGQPLESNTQPRSEERSGHDFNAVRIHSDASSAASTSSGVMLQRQPAGGSGTVLPSVTNECAGWEQDPQSFAIHLARHVGKTYLDPSVEVTASGDHPSVVCIDDRHCDVMLSNGVRIRATWQPSTRIALARYEDADDESHRFIFNYSCPNGQMRLDFQKYIKGDHHSVPSPPPQPRSWRDRVKDWFRPPIPIAPKKGGATQP